jgi:hypothetical protein
LKLSVGKQTASFLRKRLVQRGEAFGQVGLIALRDGEEFLVAPDAGRAGGDGFAGKAAADGVEIEVKLQRRQAVRATGERLIAVALAALVAAQLILCLLHRTGRHHRSTPLGCGVLRSGSRSLKKMSG